MAKKVKPNLIINGEIVGQCAHIDYQVYRGIKYYIEETLDIYNTVKTFDLNTAQSKIISGSHSIYIKIPCGNMVRISTVTRLRVEVKK